MGGWHRPQKEERGQLDLCRLLEPDSGCRTGSVRNQHPGTVVTNAFRSPENAYDMGVCRADKYSLQSVMAPGIRYLASGIVGELVWGIFRGGERALTDHRH
jgi:hypothetical protein